MTLKEKARAKVKELDARMAELNSLYENESDPKKQKEINYLKDAEYVVILIIMVI